MVEINPFSNSPREKYCVIYVVRHGQTDLNVSKTIQGQLDEPLNEKGKEQAKNIAAQIKNVHFDAIFSSSLVRAKETAETIAIEHDLAVESKAALSEKNYGELEGKSQKIIEDLFKEFEKMSKEEIFNYRPAPSAETDEEVISRFITALRELAIGFKGKTILIVSHHAVMRLLLVHLGFAKYIDIPPGTIQNTAVFTILSDGIDFYLDKIQGVEFKK